MASKPVNHKDIAEYLNIAQSTVSRALDPNKSHMISEVTRNKIVTAAEKLGFRANIYAQRMRKLKTDTLTLVIDGQQLYGRDFLDFHIHHEALTWDLICGVIEYCNENEFDVKLLPLLKREEKEISEISKHIGYPYSDGVIFLGYKYLEKAHEVVTAQKIPAVIMGALTSQAEKLAEVSVDPAPGIRDAVRYLYNKGHRKIAFFQYSESDNNVICQRRHAFIMEMEALGIFSAELILTAPNEQGIKQLATERKVIDAFSAMICFNDSMADRLIREFIYAGISIPDEKAVIGFDNNPAYPTLSTVEVPRKEAGRQAAKMVIEAVKNKTQCSRNIVIDSKFIPRSSS